MREDNQLKWCRHRVGLLVDLYSVPLLCREIILNLIYMYYIHRGENLDVF